MNNIESNNADIYKGLPALADIRIMPCLAEDKKTVIIFDVYFGEHWQGSRRSIEAAKFFASWKYNRLKMEAKANKADEEAAAWEGMCF